MKQLFDERHIGLPIVLIYPTGELATDFLAKYHIALQNSCAMINEMRMDIDFIFRMLDYSGYVWVQWIAIDEDNAWRGYENEPCIGWGYYSRSFFELWIQISGRKTDFPFWPYPGDWRDSLIKRPIEDEKEINRIKIVCQDCRTFSGRIYCKPNYENKKIFMEGI